MTTECFLAIGGTHWTSSDGLKQRVYVPVSLLENIVGLTYTRDKTGNISGASLNGVKLSNGKAEKLRTTLALGKCWYDAHTQTIETQGFGTYAAAIPAEIVRRAQHGAPHDDL